MQEGKTNMQEGMNEHARLKHVWLHDPNTQDRGNSPYVSQSCCISAVHWNHEVQEQILHASKIFAECGGNSFVRGMFMQNLTRRHHGE